MDSMILYVAKKKMRIKRGDQQSIFFTTVWNGEVVIGNFDLATNKVSQLTCFRTLNFEEMGQLTGVINNYLGDSAK